MKLSKRLFAIATFIEQYSHGCILGDIGSDHAYLPCYLALNHIIHKGYACDVAKLPLKSAEKSILSYGVEHIVSAKLGNGIEPLKDSDVNTISISGMGAFLIEEILEANLNVAKNMNKLILQANANVDHLRSYLNEKGFRIIDEAIIHEGNHYYEILVVEYTGEIQMLDHCDIYFGPILKKNPCDVFIVKWNKQLEVFKKLVVSLDQEHAKRKELNDKIKLIEEVLNESK